MRRGRIGVRRRLGDRHHVAIHGASAVPGRPDVSARFAEVVSAEAEQVRRRSGRGGVGSPDRGRYLLAAVLLLIIAALGAVDVVRGDRGRLVVQGILGIVVVTALLTLARLPGHPDASRDDGRQGKGSPT